MLSVCKSKSNVNDRVTRLSFRDSIFKDRVSRHSHIFLRFWAIHFLLRGIKSVDHLG